MLLNDRCRRNNFGTVSMYGGDIGINIAGSAAGDGHGNVFGTVIAVGQATWAVFMDANSTRNTIAVLCTNGSVGNSGTNNLIVTNVPV